MKATHPYCKGLRWHSAQIGKPFHPGIFSLCNKPLAPWAAFFPYQFHQPYTSLYFRLFSLPLRFIFKDQYIELSTRLPRDAHLYGLGEVSLPTGLLLPRDGSTITLWARDMPSANPHANLYGSHPFYLQLNAGKWAAR